MKDLKVRTIRGGLAKLCAQLVNAFLRVASLMILARLLSPSDYGLVAMVIAVVGALGLFKDLGLSTATIQRTSVTDGQLSALFWINILVGLSLTCIALASAPLIAAFYHDPRLVPIGAALSFSFLLSAFGIQHAALLERQMRFVLLAVIDTTSTVVGVLIGIAMALLGAEYWAIVSMSLTVPAAYSASVWLTSGWRPGPPRKGAGIASMIRTGGIVTANGLIVYAAYNLDKVLLGRFWGAEALGLYGRAYQLISIPTENLNSAVGTVALSALSRVKDEPARLKRYFLKSYALLIAITLPITAICGVFADDLILVVLGSQWLGSAPVFRLLTPTILILGMINPLWPLLVAQGLVVRSFKLALTIAPLAIAGYTLGLPWGPQGVALGFSTAMILWVVPHIAWAVHGTVVSVKDIVATIVRPLLAVVVATSASGVIVYGLLDVAPPLLRLSIGAGVLLSSYALILMYAMKQKALFVDVIRGLNLRSLA